MAIKIALADDHELVRRGIKLLLENLQDFEVIVEASNGKELIEKIEKEKVCPVITLIDVNMPVMGGLEAVKHLRKKFPEMKIIALSVSDDFKTVREMIRAGANAYLVKDSTPETVHQTLLQVNENGFFYDKRVIESLIDPVEKAQRLKKKSPELQLQLEELTMRELEFMRLCCSEFTYKEIANEMKISLRTVDGHREAVFTKLDIKSRTGLVMFAFQNGIISIDEI